MAPCRCLLWSLFQCFKQDWQYPTSIILSLQLRETDVERERDTGPPGTATATPLAGFAGASMSLHTGGTGTWLALDLLPCSFWATNHPEPQQLRECQVCLGSGHDHRMVAALINPAAWGQIKVSPLSECRLHWCALFTASCAKWLLWFAGTEQSDLSSKGSENPTSFDSEKTWLLHYLSANIWISGTYCMHHSLIKLLPGALPE